MSVAGKLALLKRTKCCAGKLRHPSEGKAQAHLRALARIDDRPMDVYRCRFCGHWHVGHAKYLKVD